jgi:fumarate hydratase subunit beta
MMRREMTTPLDLGEVRSLEVGDRMALSGTVLTMRDQATMRLLSIVRDREEPPVDIRGGVVFHAGPAVDRARGIPRVTSIGPTTSARMNTIMPELIRALGIRCVIGKGGMDRAVSDQMVRTGCVYASALGGCAALYTRSVEGVSRVVWEEMGPEALYEIEVKGMAPLVVTMDSRGNSLHEEVGLQARRRLGEILGREG